METVGNLNLAIIAASIGLRFASIIMNLILAYKYWVSEFYAFSAWTVGSIVVSMVITSLIYIHIFSSKASISIQKRILDQGVFLNVVLAYLFRDGYAFYYTRKLKNIKEAGDREGEIILYQKLISEECNVGFIRLFDSFLESAPQKILQLVIVLWSMNDLSYFRLATFVVYFSSIAWGIQSYNRSNRLVQFDKRDIESKGRLIQFAFLLCLTTSRTLCIACLASLFPKATLVVCAAHVFVCVCIIFAVDSPTIADSRLMNCLYCACFGIVYLFIFTSVKDTPTKYKYVFYLSFCSFENIVACVLFFSLHISIFIIALYIFGIVLIIIYYWTCHPSISLSTFPFTL
ncbi:XK-related protein 6 isoform X1 [Drosophila bipectinata]|uniref:XK-related protein 6 isoform X1 n=1 Tax=Drosophila bipectinata TaxID=42026 RepID=UPI001C8A5373|nr:XK-related protein 6 isoform X1 [Drosophila bipectinata]